MPAGFVSLANYCTFLPALQVNLGFCRAPRFTLLLLCKTSSFIYYLAKKITQNLTLKFLSIILTKNFFPSLKHFFA